ncbi:MAG: hypothetical protein HYY06_06835 [Deltaproteobacteria bacterium]|nr:hypothetical protein [Deltaproteobacteria bacterium]
MNKFEALEVAMQLVDAMPRVIEQVAKHDKNMATQMKDALGSIAATTTRSLRGAQRSSRCGCGSLGRSGTWMSRATLR